MENYYDLTKNTDRKTQRENQCDFTSNKRQMFNV